MTIFHILIARSVKIVILPMRFDRNSLFDWIFKNKTVMAKIKFCAFSFIILSSTNNNNNGNDDDGDNNNKN